ncbi:MAG: hypothetical protein ABI427_17145, partial [Solirubrobacteraceae bacterium]
AVDDRVRRTGLVHAVSNAAALALYTASLAARRRGSRRQGAVLPSLSTSGETLTIEESMTLRAVCWA